MKQYGSYAHFGYYKWVQFAYLNKLFKDVFLIINKGNLPDKSLVQFRLIYTSHPASIASWDTKSPLLLLHNLLTWWQYCSSSLPLSLSYRLILEIHESYLFCVHVIMTVHHSFHTLYSPSLYCMFLNKSLVSLFCIPQWVRRAMTEITMSLTLLCLVHVSLKSPSCFTHCLSKYILHISYQIPFWLWTTSIYFPELFSHCHKNPRVSIFQPKGTVN